VIEPLLEAERAMSFGLIDQAERLYRQVAEHDPKNSIAVVGLARVALERGDEHTAYLEAMRASAIDPENPAAQNLVLRLAEVMEGRGEALPEAPAEADGAKEPARPAPATADAVTQSGPEARRSLVDRLLGRNR
jgi:thioredoxin-like negative regulator of GroEL